MALFEVNAAQRATAPYAMVGMLETTWPDGKISIGTCAIVGTNDVLTAGHCVYDPSHGGFATNFKFYFGADYNSARNIIEASGLSITSGAPISIVYNKAIYADNDPETFWRYESQYDVALIGLPNPIRGVGMLPLDFGQDRDNLSATEVGYPSGSTGMMTANVQVDRHSVDAVYVSEVPSMGPGSSGGPLLLDGAIIGIKSSGSVEGSNWADIGLSETTLRAAMLANDRLLPNADAASGLGANGAELLIGSPDNDRIDAGGGDDTVDAGAGNDTIAGGSGIDTVRFVGARSRFEIKINNGTVTVTDSQRTLGTDQLSDVEKIMFSDQWVTTDISGTNAQAYRIYQAAFDRIPDLPGLGYWMSEMARGMNVVEVAARFIDSNEFRQLYGSNPSPSTFITRLYQNVLDRTPDGEGLAWWTNQMQTNPEKTSYKVLADFSESPENQANVATQITNGIAYLPFDLL